MIDETWTFLTRRAGHARAVEFLQAVTALPGGTIRHIDEDVEDDGGRCHFLRCSHRCARVRLGAGGTMVATRGTSEDDVPTIPSVTAIRRDVTSGGHDRARRALRAVPRVIAAAAAAVGDAVQIVLSAPGDGPPSPSPGGLRPPMPALVPAVVPVRVAHLATATARRRAGMAAHPAGSCCRW